MHLENQFAVVTGAGRGIGRAIALAFAREGCHIAAVARSRKEIEETADEVRMLGRKALPILCDIGDAAAVTAMADTVRAAFPQVDILVNNAGLALFKPFWEITEEDWSTTMAVNLTGPFRCIQAFLPDMMARRKGRILNISSVTGLKAIQHQSAYTASKHGLNGLTKALALDLRPYGISAHALCPGGVVTRLSEEAMPERDKSDWMTPEDVAHWALALATMAPQATVDILPIRRYLSEPIG